MRKARRHREELGEVIEVFADRPGPKTVTGIVLGWVLFTGLTFINPGETPLLAVAPGIIFAVMFGLILLYLSGERLIVCERGILVGSVAPGIRPYVIPFQQITPGSIAGVAGANRYLKEVGLQGQIAQSTLRASWWTKNGVHFVACSAEDARRGRRRFTVASTRFHGRSTAVGSGSPGQGGSLRNQLSRPSLGPPRRLGIRSWLRPRLTAASSS